MRYPNIKIDITPIDTIVLKFYKEAPNPLYKGPEKPGWGCYNGPDWIAGMGGFGPTPLAALKDFCLNCEIHEGTKTDNGKVVLR